MPRVAAEAHPAPARWDWTYSVCRWWRRGARLRAVHLDVQRVPRVGGDRGARPCALRLGRTAPRSRVPPPRRGTMHALTRRGSRPSRRSSGWRSPPNEQITTSGLTQATAARAVPLEVGTIARVAARTGPATGAIAHRRHGFGAARAAARLAPGHRRRPWAVDGRRPVVGGAGRFDRSVGRWLTNRRGGFRRPRLEQTSRKAARLRCPWTFGGGVSCPSCNCRRFPGVY